MTKNNLFLTLLFICFISCSSPEEWILEWHDDFNAPQLDETVWSRTDRGIADWSKTQSKDPRCMELRDGLLILKGFVNDDLTTDSAEYLTGGIWTKYTKGFEPGRFEVRCRLHGAKGSWPAIWLLPSEYTKYPWPTGGEIDIMERLNHDSIVYQTVHSSYTVKMEQRDNPLYSRTTAINPEEFNVYGVDMYPDSIVFHINGNRTHVYPRLTDGDACQFPFYIKQYLIIDMQIGGNWVGEVDNQQLPVEMEIDWVKYYHRR